MISLRRANRFGSVAERKAVPLPTGSARSAWNIARGGWVGLVVALIGFSPCRAEMLRGPYVLLEDTQLLRIRFEVDRPDDEVTLLHGADARSRVTPSYARGKRDTFIADVAVDLSRYRDFRGYEIGRVGEKGKGYGWRSRINGATDEYPRLLVFGDSQGGAVTLQKLGQQWGRERFDLVVGLGDLADAGSRYESWSEEFFEPLRDFLPHYPFLAICGNHDSYREKSLEWYDWYFGRSDGRRYFKIDFGDLRFIGLNNSDVHTKYGFDPIDPLTPQYDFLLESALGSAAAGRKLALFSHIPIFSGSTVINAEFGSELQRKYVLPILERARVLGFFAGHHHKFERIARPGLRGMVQHITTGGAGGKLFTVARERGGFQMDREIFEVYHYLTVDFSGAGTVIAHALGGGEIDRVTFAPAAAAAAASVLPEIWGAKVADDLSVAPGVRLGATLTLTASPAAAVADENAFVTAQLLRTEHGTVALAPNLAATGASAVSFQGYDWPRQTWSYLQGGSLVIPVAGMHGKMAVVALNGAKVSPLDACLPVLHWPLAAGRAGINDQAGAMMLLKGREDFELDSDPARLLTKWKWGERSVEGVPPPQWARQWVLMQTAPAALVPQSISAKELFQLIAGTSRPDGYLVQVTERQPVAVLVHWPKFQCLAIVAGESIAAGTGSLFVSTGREIRIETAIAAGVLALRVGQQTGETLVLPLDGGSKGKS